MIDSHGQENEKAGIIPPLLGIAVVAIIVGIAWIVGVDWTHPTILGAVGIPGILGVFAVFILFKNIQTLESYNPVYVIKKDLNEPRKILFNLLILVGFWGVAGLIWVFVGATPAEASRMIGEIWADQRYIVYGFVGINVLLVLGILFTENRGGSGP